MLTFSGKIQNQLWTHTHTHTQHTHTPETLPYFMCTHPHSVSTPILHLYTLKVMGTIRTEHSHINMNTKFSLEQCELHSPLPTECKHTSIK